MQTPQTTPAVTAQNPMAEVLTTMMSIGVAGGKGGLAPSKKLIVIMSILLSVF